MIFDLYLCPKHQNFLRHQIFLQEKGFFPVPLGYRKPMNFLPETCTFLIPLMSDFTPGSLCGHPPDFNPCGLKPFSGAGPYLTPPLSPFSCRNICWFTAWITRCSLSCNSRTPLRFCHSGCFCSRHAFGVFSF